MVNNSSAAKWDRLSHEQLGRRPLSPDGPPKGLYHQRVHSVLLKTERTIRGEARNPWKGSD